MKSITPIYKKMKKSSYLQEFRNKYFWRAVFAELLAATYYIFFVTTVMTDFATSSGKGLRYIKACLTTGFSAAVIIKTTGPISGGYMNPAVTFGAFINGDLSAARTLMYTIAQFIGGVFGAGLTYLLTPNGNRGNLGSVHLGRNVTWIQGLFMELILTIMLTLCVLISNDKKKVGSFGPPAIVTGFAYLSFHFVGMEYTGGSINPSRAFGPAIVMNEWGCHWLYWVGPYIGATIAGLLYRFVFSFNESDEPPKPVKPMELEAFSLAIRKD